VGHVDAVERLHHVGLGQVPLPELADRRRLVVELGDAPVAVRVVVVGVDDDLLAQRPDRHVAVGLERDRHDDDVAGRAIPTPATTPSRPY